MGKKMDDIKGFCGVTLFLECRLTLKFNYLRMVLSVFLIIFRKFFALTWSAPKSTIVWKNLANLGRPL